MVARPGRPQAAFTAGELDPLLHDRTTLKYFSTGLRRAENVVMLAQGGFRLRDYTRHVGALLSNAQRIFPFAASNGSAFDLVMAGDNCQVWGATANLASFTISGVGSLLGEVTDAQQFDTMLLFHEDLRSKRIRLTNTGWVVDDLPYEEIPNYDYGGVYTNGVPAKWRLEFVGLAATTTTFVLTVSGQETQSIAYDSTMATLAATIKTAVEDLPNVSAGITVAAGSGSTITIEFTGAGNEGDGWAVSGRVINKADAAVLAVKQVAGVIPGEPVISTTKGWPQCGAFYGQALFVGGLKSLPNAWMRSKVGDYFNFDQRFTEANGPFLVPMDIAGGEKIERIVPSLNLLIFTTQAEYWIAERAISKTQAPNHVQASRHGCKRGVPIVENEGAAIWCHANGATIGELRYTDVEGNFVGTDISLLASHLLTDVRDMAVRRATETMDGNVHAIVLGDGNARLVTMLREQEVTAYTRLTTDGLAKAVARNARNDLSWIMERGGQRFLERMEAGLLLDEAQDFSFGPASDTITGLSRFNGRQVWVIGDSDVFGPYTVADASLKLPIAVSAATVGTWKPPIIETLPPPRDVGPNVVLKRKARIHTVHISLVDTTSVAISTNGKAVRNVELARYGAFADVPELEQGFTGTIKISGLRGYADDPFVTISQVRPGRLNVRAITVETAL
ncbi:hypothetical protein [Sinorhizobium fredii]|uniref:hypothetical protein n=1 Tax=Rhizobium fredii TaxID=380 RepID=UPI0004B25548|nr:hypothetical protein [Sinorhizobium fredii]ASY69385.1 Phage protein [Sinorhizobium fredii CCBAU 83666]